MKCNRFIMIMQVCHAIADGSSAAVLMHKFSTFYKHIKEDFNYEPNQNQIQYSPFYKLACVKNNQKLKFIQPQFAQFLKVLSKIPSNVPDTIVRSLGWRLKYYTNDNVKLCKYKNNKMTESLLLYQSILQISYGLQKGAYQDGSVILACYSHRIYEYLYPYDFKDIIGNSVENVPLILKIKKDMTVDDIMDQITKQVQNMNNMTKDQFLDHVIAGELTKCETRTIHYPVTIYSVTLGQYKQTSSDIFDCVIMAPCQNTTDHDIKVLNFVVVGTKNGYLFNFDDQYFTNQQQDRIIEKFWYLNAIKLNGNERVADIIKFDEDLLQ